MMLNAILSFQESIFLPLLKLAMNKKCEDLKMAHFYKAKAEFNKLERFLQGKDFAMGYLTIADFFFAEYAHYVKILYPAEFNGFKGLKAIQ